MEKFNPNVIDELCTPPIESYSKAFKKRIFKASKEIEKDLIRGQAIPLQMTVSDKDDA